jgi:signal peptidase I
VFVVGIDDEGHIGRAVCPNCGERAPDQQPWFECGGDRVLVQKLIYDFRRPKRWEVAVFHFPGDPIQAYVKRVVGLPGEAIRISGGDVFVNGSIVRKSWADQRATRILVHDSRFQPQYPGGLPRYGFRSDQDHGQRASGWSLEGGRFRHEAILEKASPVDDWLIYRHVDPARRSYGPVTDFYAYNGGELRGENEIADLSIEARVSVSDSVESLAVDLQSGADRFVVRVPVSSRGSVALFRNGRAVDVLKSDNPLASSRARPRTFTLDASVVDRRVQVAIDGQLLFEPFDYERDVRNAAWPGESPIALGVRGGAATVSELRIYRDIYYTSTLANTPRQPHDMRSDVRLGPDEYFVLGDNSPVSNDSRFWSEGPLVPGSMLVGKPFLVHLPGQVVPFKVFGRSVCWVPDPRKIRYIR